MVKTIAPRYSSLAPELIKSYSPPEEKIHVWHTVKNGHTESLATIARQYGVPAERLIEFNFPGSVAGGRIHPDIVNWYLYHHERTRCREVTRDGANYMFRGGEKIAVPYLGRVEAGEPAILAPTNTRFKIRMHLNLNVSVIAALDFSIFQIWDEKARKCSFYTYWAGGISKGVTPGWLSGTMDGPWTDMVVTKPMAVNQFTGATRFTTGGGGNTTLNYINFMDLPRGSQTVPNPFPMNTGFTLGIGGASSVGAMKLALVGTPDGLLPFQGQ